MENLKKISLFFFLLFFLYPTTAQEVNLEQVEKNIDYYINYYKLKEPGSIIAIIEKGNVLLSKAYGESVMGEDEMTTNHMFELAGLSKSITAAAILKLVDKNKLKLDNSISDIFDDFPGYGRMVKIKHLLNHTSGLKNFSEVELSNTDNIIDFLRKQDSTKFEPGTKWSYSNSEYPLLAEILEEVSGKTFSEFINRYILKKLSMDSTLFYKDLKKELDVVKGYSYRDGEYYESKNEQPLFYGERGIYTTISDYAKWDKSLYTDRILDCQSLNFMFTTQSSTSDNIINFYNCGWVLMKKEDVRYFWHGTEHKGISNYILHLPDQQLTVFVHTNSNKSNDYLKLLIKVAKQFHRNLPL